ncbi:MAG: RrF2 family transcriptional regulator [Planctomycetota bacterium]
MLSTTAEYALRIMILLAESHTNEDTRDSSLTSEQIAVLTNVPADYAVKVLQWLGRAHLVHGRRGRGGGFRIACDPSETTMLDVVNVIDPMKRISSCPIGRSNHSNVLCPLHRRLDEIQGMLEDSLRSMTLVDVIEDGGGDLLCVDDNLRSTVLGYNTSAKGMKNQRLLNKFDGAMRKQAAGKGKVPTVGGGTTRTDTPARQAASPAPHSPGRGGRSAS